MEGSGGFAVVIAGHGSRDPQGIGEFLKLADGFRSSNGNRLVEVGFLEFAQPTVEGAVDACVRQGARHVVVLPGFLLGARHAKDDLPSEMHWVRRKYPGVTFTFGRPLHIHSKILQLCRKRIEEAEASSATSVQRHETCLLVVGRGSSDPDANGDLFKLSRILWEGMRFGWSQACAIGITYPLLGEALDRTARIGFRRILVFPFFLFTGRLIQRIYALCDRKQLQYPEAEILKAGYLGVDPLLMEVFLERAEEAVAGLAHMNCSLCQYRMPIVGFEGNVGAPQKAHHGHVRGGWNRMGREA